MALGALALSRQKAVVSKLESIEEIAGIDVLCCDKTGTLTQNRLTLGEPVVFEAADAQDLVLAAALASSSKDSGGMDAIDSAIMAELPDKTLPGGYTQISFIPFDPVRKRTEAKINNSLGRTFRVSKGAPQVILKIAEISADTQAKALKVIEEMAVKGYRTLGVARADLNGPWRFLGLLPLFDPPREDSARTIAQAKTHGIAVKMVTGDNLAIARETADKLGLGKEIVPADVFFNEIAGKQEAVLSQDAGKRIEAAAGFAQVFPEHKYDIVKALQERGHLVGMTGDGVNDAPALKQADVGIAVSGAADAARAAADLVLTAPGLNVIVNAVEEARRIFERMNSYSIYRIAETIRIMFFVVTAMIFFNFYPITTIMIILLAFFNDVPIMAIAYDNTWLDTAPVRWHMRRVLTVSTLLGFVGTVSSFLLLWFFKDVFKFGINEIQTLIFLKLAVAGHLTLFITRTRSSFWTHPLPSPLLFWSAAITKLAATFLVVYPMGLLTPISWGLALLVWAYALAWMFISDTVKVFVYRRLAAQTAP
jgi:H+-transporting ATPase